MKLYIAIFVFSFCLHACQTGHGGWGGGGWGGKNGGGSWGGNNGGGGEDGGSNSKSTCPFVDQVVEDRDVCGVDKIVTCDFLKKLRSESDTSTFQNDEDFVKNIEIHVNPLICVLNKMEFELPIKQNGQYQLSPKTLGNLFKLAKGMDPKVTTNILKDVNTCLGLKLEESNNKRRSIQQVDKKDLKHLSFIVMCMIQKVNADCDNELIKALCD